MDPFHKVERAFGVVLMAAVQTHLSLVRLIITAAHWLAFMWSFVWLLSLNYLRLNIKCIICPLTFNSFIDGVEPFSGSGLNVFSSVILLIIDSVLTQSVGWFMTVQLKQLCFNAERTRWNYFSVWITVDKELLIDQPATAECMKFWSKCESIYLSTDRCLTNLFLCLT